MWQSSFNWTAHLFEQANGIFSTLVMNIQLVQTADHWCCNGVRSVYGLIVNSLLWEIPKYYSTMPDTDQGETTTIFHCIFLMSRVRQILLHIHYICGYKKNRQSSGCSHFWLLNVVLCPWMNNLLSTFKNYQGSFHSSVFL